MKSNILKYAVFLIALMLLSSACTRKPKNLIKEDAMVEFLTDAYMLEGFYAVEHQLVDPTTSPDMDPVVLASYDELFEKHSVTKEQFDASMDYYMRHSDKYESIHKKVLEKIEEYPLD